METLFALFLITIGAGLRLLPHAPNFAPIGAIALFSGRYLPKRITLIIPILAMIVSDIFIGYYSLSVMISVYFSFVLIILLGFWLKNNKKWHNVLGASLLGSISFFIITNFAVFAFTPWYQKSLFGLIQCYFMALPFFRNSLIGDLFYTSAFFGFYELTRRLIIRARVFREA